MDYAIQHTWQSLLSPLLALQGDGVTHTRICNSTNGCRQPAHLSSMQLIHLHPFAQPLQHFPLLAPSQLQSV